MKKDFDNEHADAGPMVEAQVIEDSKGPEPQAQEAPKANFAHIMAVWFDYFRADGTKGSDRVFIFDCPGIRTRAQLEHYEQLLGEQGNFSRVIITNWRNLEG